MIKLDTILVATDFSECSEAALEYGRALARHFGATVHLIHVVEMSPLWAGSQFTAYDVVLIQQTMEEEARKALADVANKDLGPPPTLTIVKTAPSPALAIVDYAREAKVDLIVMGTHGRGMMGHLLLGSAAERVVRIAPCPVLTVRHPEREFVTPDALQVVAAQSKEAAADDQGVRR